LLYKNVAKQNICPSSKSNLYNVQWKNSQQVDQPFPDLFKKEEFGPTETNPHKNTIGFALFNNATRQQLKDLTKNTQCS
jgi:hypothetical protein